VGLPSLLPTLIGYGVSGATATVSEPWDVTLGGYKFMLAAGPENPFIRRGAQYRSDQVNFSGEPGEVALGFWWQRSQDSWHFGTGAPTFDGTGSGTAAVAAGRFADSYGVDPWTPGRVSLLHDTDLVHTVSADAKDLVAFTSGGVEKIAWLDGLSANLWDGTTYTTAAKAPPAWKSLTTDGTSLYYTDGVIVFYDTTGSDVTLYTGMTGTTFVLRYAKQRLMLGVDNKIYELDTTAVGAALPTELFKHPNPDWVWSDIVGGPGAIYASGYAGTTSAIYKFVLDATTGALPTLAQGITACELPAGEKALCLKAYLQLFIAVGTSQGLRVCSFSETDIVLSPLTVVDAGPVRSVTAWDRFLYATCDDAGSGSVGLVRVDLSAQTDTDRYAWAKDARGNSDPAGFTAVIGESTSVVMFDGMPAFLSPSNAVYSVSSTRLCESGSITSGRILFGMADYKVFQRGSFTTSGTGSVALSTGTDSDTGDVARTTIDTAVVNRIEVEIGSTRGSTLTVRLDLTRATTTAGPELLSWTMKALPSQPREDQFLVPLRCYDRVENAFGETSYASAIESLDAVETLKRTQQPTIFQTFFGDNVDDWRTWVVQVDDYEFRQTTSDGNWGGLLTVSLRTVSGE
jgi:hypothetical protein